MVLLTGAEVEALRKRLSLKQNGAAKVFGGDVVAFSEYESDDVTQSEAMDKLLREADRFPEVLQDLLTEAGFTVSTTISSNVTMRDAADNLVPNL